MCQKPNVGTFYRDRIASQEEWYGEDVERYKEVYQVPAGLPRFIQRGYSHQDEDVYQLLESEDEKAGHDKRGGTDKTRKDTEV